MAMRAAVFGWLVLSASFARCEENAGGGLFDVRMPDLIRRADLNLKGPVNRSEAGLPIGNGRMGTLLWTSPRALHLQINRVDVFGNNKDSNSFPQRYSDYCGGCAFVDVDAGGDVFTEWMTQHLSCNSGLATIQGEGMRVRSLASMDRDMIAIEVTDERTPPAPITVRLRMLRPTDVRQLEQTATSRLRAEGKRVVLTQAFAEGEYFCGSGVAVGVAGRGVEVGESGEQEIWLRAKPQSGSFTVFVSSAATFDRQDDVAAAASEILDDVADESFSALLAANETWWSDFWSRGFVWLRSDDGVADMIAEHYAYYLYLMASSSRGKYPTKFNGMLWVTGGDERQWGGQYWGANQSCLYNALLPANRPELLDPMFDMYTGMYDACATAAEQQWGSKGVFLPETVAFDGLAELPEDVAAEMRDLYLMRKPMRSASARFIEFSKLKQPHSSRWNWWGGGEWIDGEWRPTLRPEAPYGAVTHIFSRGAKIAYQFWQRYEFTGDEAWLRERAYPMLKGVAEFYRNFPNVRKDADGKYHLYHVNSNESIRGAKDADEEIASMRAIFPTVIRASEILGVDAEMRPVWQEFLDNLAPLPLSSDVGIDESRPYWIRGLPPFVDGDGRRRPDGNTMPHWFFDLCTLENSDAATMAVANATLDGYGGRGGGVLSKVGVSAAMMGRADDVRVMLARQITSPDRAPVMANRMDMREGRQATSAQRLGRAADVLHNALLQSVGAGPAEPPVIRVFPAWPRAWDAAYTLLARGGFLVTASMRDGEIEFVGIESQIGGKCRVRNPWGEGEVAVHRDDAPVENARGSLLTFETRSGERIALVRSGTTPEQFRRSLP
jgi:hypothetical protein